MGRAAHNYSRRKLPLLHSALDSFVTCSAILPSTIPVPDNNSESSSPASLVESWTASDFSESPSPVGALVSSITDIIDKSMLCPDDDPFISDSEGWVELALDIPENLPPRMPQDDQRLMPSPLRLRNSSVDLHKTGRQNQPARLCPPPLLFLSRFCLRMLWKRTPNFQDPTGLPARRVEETSTRMSTNKHP